MAKYTQDEMNILINIIGAVETGGQIYGQARYDDYTPAYTNSSAEVSCTIGAFQEYNNLAKGLLKEILQAYPITFRKYDNAGIENDLKKNSWVGYSPNRGSAKAKAIQAIISSTDGRKIQNIRIQRQMVTYIEYAEKLGVSDVDALFMCANFIHQGGYSACERILRKTKKPYTLDHLYAACKTDTGNQVGAYKTRQSKVYDWLKEKISNTTIQEGGNIMSNKITKDQSINAVIKIATNEIGYLEKKTNSQLDSKTANAGYNNYTKYWRDVYPAYQTQPWCACFVSWVFMKVFGLETAKKLLKHWPYVYCPTLGDLFTKNANPKVGDIVIFYRNGTFAHTGLVTKVQGDKFWTIEGNTSGASGIVANGGGVCEKSYYNSQLPGTKFCTPNYSIVTKILSNSTSNSTSTPSSSSVKKNYLTVGDKGSDVKSLQTKLNTVGYEIEVDGVYGSATKSAVMSFQKKYNLSIDGIAGKNTITKLDSVIATQNKKHTSTTSTSKAPSKTRKFVGRVNKNDAPVRKNPGKKYEKLTSYPILNKGNLVDICDTVKSASGNNWYYICIANKYYGYIYSAHIDRV